MKNRNHCIATPANNAIHGPREANGIDDMIAAKSQAAANAKPYTKRTGTRHICRVPGVNDHLFV